MAGGDVRKADDTEPVRAIVQVSVDGGDQPGFSDVFRRLFPRAVARLQRLGWDRPSAEDAAVEAFARAYASWDELRSVPHLDAWILRVAANVACDQGRKNVRAARTTFVRHEGDNTDSLVMRQVLADALRKLPRRQREAIVLRHGADLSFEETARALGCSVSSAKAHERRAVQRLRTLVVEDQIVELVDHSQEGEHQ